MYNNNNKYYNIPYFPYFPALPKRGKLLDGRELMEGERGRKRKYGIE